MPWEPPTAIFFTAASFLSKVSNIPSQHFAGFQQSFIDVKFLPNSPFVHLLFFTKREKKGDYFEHKEKKDLSKELSKGVDFVLKWDSVVLS